MRLLLLIVAQIAAATLQAAVPPSKSDVARYAEQLLADNYAKEDPGVAVIVARGDEVLFRGARGMASIELGVPLSPDQVFEIGSVSKQFTAAGLLKLVEQGKLRLDDPLTKFVPGYPNGDKISVRMLLNHTSGIKSIAESEGDFSDRFLSQKMTIAQVIDIFKNEKPDFAPGTDWHYNNSAYVLDGAIIEAVSGMSWQTYLQQALFAPLGLSHTGFGDETLALIPGHVRGYSWHDGHWAAARYMDMSVPATAGALVSTVDDLLRWNRALHEGRVLKPDSYRQMITPTGNAVKDRYGFGIWHETLRGTDVLQHGGDIFGFSAYLIYLPREHVSVAALYNTDFDSARPGNMNVQTLARLLAAYVIGKPYAERKPIAIDAAMLKQYEGVYRIDAENTRMLRVTDGKLTSQRTGSPLFNLIPVAKDTFVFDGNEGLSRMVFEKNSAGKIVRMRFFPQDEGGGDVVPRTNEPLPAQHISISLPKSSLRRLVGKYVGGDMTMTIELQDDKLTAQLDGQPAFEIFAESPTRFFAKIVDATLDFAPGESPALSITLHQDGQDVVFQRKP